MTKIVEILYKFAFIAVIICLLQGYTFAQNQKKNTKLLPNLFKKEKLSDIISTKNKDYEVQIIYTQIHREKNDKIKFTDYHYKIDKKQYFYPSNTVFLPAAALTLEKINELSKEHDINKDRYVRIDNAINQGIIIYQDPSSESNYASFAHFIKKMLVSGDKNSYNHCYDFLNQRHFNERMHNLGYRNSWFLHKLDNNVPEASRQSNTVTFFRTDIQSYYTDIIYLKRHPTIIPFYSVHVEKGELNPDNYYSNREKIFLGKEVDQNGNVLDSSVNFSNRNKFTIEDMHNFLKSLIFPDIYNNNLELSKDDYAFLYKQMAENDSTLNYLFNHKLDDPSIKIFNNSGKDIGFMIDNAYIIDTKNGVDFFLTVVIKCNKTDILGDKYYEYDEIGLPLMRSISNIIHKHAINANKQYTDFSDFINKIK